MKRIYKNSDIQLSLSEIKGLGEKFIIKFYTTNKDFFIKKTDENVIEDYLKLNWNELETIGDGVLNYIVNNLADDSDYDDGIYNNTFSGTTNYYLKTGIIVDDEPEKTISEIVAEINTGLQNEVTRSTDKDTEHDTAIESLFDKIDTEISDRENADNVLKSLIEAETSRATGKEKLIEKKIGEVELSVASEAERAKGIEKNLTEAISTETKRATARENEIEAKFADYETISVHNSDVQIINANIEKKVDKTTYATDKAAIEAEISKKANIGDSYTKAESDAKYLTEHQDISNLATKTELTTLQNNLQDAIDTETSRARAKENSLKADINDLETKLNDYETIEKHNSDIATLDSKINTLNGKVATKANAEDVYTKTESDAKYLTEHQDISNLATKTELSTVQTNLQTSIDTKQDELTAGDGIEITDKEVIKIADNYTFDCGTY